MCMREMKPTDIYPIERGIPVPKVRPAGGPKYPWGSLQVDESFLVPCAEIDLASVMNGLTSCKSWAQKKLGYRFVMRRTNKGVRVWRVK